MNGIFTTNKINRAAYPLLYIGFGSIVSQILLIREFIVSFYGNELSIGIIFAGWLIWIGIGSAAGNRLLKTNLNASHCFFFLITLTPIVTFFQIIAIKYSRGLLYAAAGEFLSIAKLIGFSFTILCFGCLLWGILFTLGAKLLSSEKEQLWHGVNKAYILDSIGCAAGGLFFSFVLVSFFTTLQIVLILFLYAWSLIVWQYFSKRKSVRQITILCLIALCCILFQPVKIIEHQINAYQWSLINDRLEFVRSIDTKYQNLSLLRMEDQYTIYSNGRPVYNLPDTYEAEIFVHSILIHRPNAKRVLVLGGGFSGLIKEILKYNVNEIIYVEIDPALVQFIESVVDTANFKALHNSRVKYYSSDGREYLSRKESPFDAIIMNIGEPSTANINRFYTDDFYRICAANLTADGIFAFSFPSSAEYISDEMKKLNASIYHTFRKAFRNTLIVPGDHAILIGSAGLRPFIQNPDSLGQLFTAAGIPTEYFSRYMFEEKMAPGRIKYITTALESMNEYGINTDIDPVTYYFDLLLWNKFLQDDNTIFNSLTRSNTLVTGIAAAGILLIVILFRGTNTLKAKRRMLIVIIACGGFTGMAVNLVLMLNFQETFGSIYEFIGAISALFLFGSALGAIIVSQIAAQKNKLALTFTLIVLACALFSIPWLFRIFLQAHSIPLTFTAAVIFGCLIGMLFGIINRIYCDKVTDLGSIYAYDVLGSSLGALTTCSLLLPVLGIREMTLLLMLILSPALFAAFLIQKQY